MHTDDSDRSIPEAFWQRLAEAVPQEVFPRLASTFSQPKCSGFRINQLLSTVETAERTLHELGISWHRLAWYRAGGYVASSVRERLLACPLIAAGHVYVQNPSSILAALLVDAKPGEQVLDLAAAPGGKALLLAESMCNEGYLAAVEPIRKRYYQLRKQLELAGVHIARTFLSDGRQIGGKVPNRFDRVLLDAPCSGEARMRADDPASWRFWSERKIREQSRKQRGLVLSAIRAMRPGGTLVYATCSFAPEENEAVIDFALRRAGAAVEIVPCTLPIDHVLPGLTSWRGRTFSESLRDSVRIVPDEVYDGFFLAKLTKNLPS